MAPQPRLGILDPSTNNPFAHPSGWLGRLAAGELGLAQMTTVRGSSNAKARRELGWQPGFPSWRDGFRHWIAAQRTA